MNRKTNVFWIIYATIFGILGIGSIYFCFTIEENNKFLGYAAPILCAIAIAIGMLYLYKGYKKEDSKLYKAFLIAYGILLFFRAPACCLIYPLRPYAAMGSIVCCVGTFGVVAVIFFAKDLGRKISLGLALYSLITTYLLAIFLFILCKGSLRGGDSATLAFNVSAVRQTVLATFLYVLVRSKYVDKTERGTK